MAKQNCWEFMQCGREPGGTKTAELGVCPAAVRAPAFPVNAGDNAGRYCWKIAGTMCSGQIQGSWAKKMDNCLNCDFFNLVKREEADKFIQ
ncbi:MAG: hypothetical protein H8E46_09160 [FCB group bacterium]|nr:hypothetical protein [FCB group bacterium]